MLHVAVVTLHQPVANAAESVCGGIPSRQESVPAEPRPTDQPVNE